MNFVTIFFFSSRRRHTTSLRDWSSDVCSSDLGARLDRDHAPRRRRRSDTTDRSGGGARMSSSETEAITAEGLEELKAEIARLEGEERQRIAVRILRAREHGDLSENAEYHAAKEDQAHL